MQHLLEILHDSQPKLQQAYLNIINLIFITVGNLPGRSGSISKLQEDKISSVMKMTRNYFLKTRGSMLILLMSRLIEHGANAAIKGKALLSIQFMYR